MQHPEITRGAAITFRCAHNPAALHQAVVTRVYSLRAPGALALLVVLNDGNTQRIARRQVVQVF